MMKFRVWMILASMAGFAWSIRPLCLLCSHSATSQQIGGFRMRRSMRTRPVGIATSLAAAALESEGLSAGALKSALTTTSPRHIENREILAAGQGAALAAPMRLLPGLLVTVLLPWHLHKRRFHYPLTSWS